MAGHHARSIERLAFEAAVRSRRPVQYLAPLDDGDQHGCQAIMSETIGLACWLCNFRLSLAPTLSVSFKTASAKARKLRPSSLLREKSSEGERSRPSLLELPPAGPRDDS